MSHCEWKPIEEAVKYSDPIYAWDGEELIHVVWDRPSWGPRTAPLSWVKIEYDANFGYQNYELRVQPKYFLSVTPPPEE
ncbi:MAG: hypothetical protein [Caudoviricetes sp.]|nr:MAG: hypothetical protein [Caudoviricetes sp.]